MPVDLTFNTLAAGTWYLGQVRYLDGATTVGTTVVNVR